MIDSSEYLNASIPQDEIGRLYDDIAGVYDLWARLTESRARKRALELAEIQNGQQVLEVAVGTGLAFYEIVRRNPNGKNIGVDLSKGMLAKAEQRLTALAGANYALQIGTAFDLQVEDGSIDVFMNSYMFDLIPFEDMDAIILEFKRVLKTGGRLILVNMTEGERFGSKFYDWVYRRLPRLMGGCRGVKLTERLQHEGLRVDVREYHQQFLFPSEVIRAYK